MRICAGFALLLAWQPFAIDHRGGAGSAVDLSSRLERPAGKHGFVRVAGGHLVDGRGRRLRLWGVNVTDWSKGSVMLPPKEDAPMWAAALARAGVNCVRLHFLDLAAPRGLIDPRRADTQAFDPQQLDRLDFWIAQLIRRGVYIDLNLNVGRSYKAGDGVADAQKIRWAKGLTMFDRRLIELEKDYARQLLTHRNPYTGKEYRREPGIAIVELLNENALYPGFRCPTPAYEAELLELYNAWLGENLPAAQLARLRAAAGTPVPRLAPPEIAAAPKERFEAEAAFYIALESRYFRDMSAYLNAMLGVRAPLIGTADHSHSGSSYALLCSTSLLDIVDGHTYWQHPGAGEHNTPMVNQPLASTVVELSRTAFAGKPYTVSETNHPFPSEYAAEGIPILAAYAAFQDWDGVFWYTFEPKLANDWQPYVGDPFDISLDPVKMPQLAAGALLFGRGDVRPARQVVARSYTREQVYASLRLPRSERPYFTPGFPRSLPLEHGSRIGSLDGPPTGTLPPAAASGAIASDTGELTWYASPEKGGLVTVDAERSQAKIGFVNAYHAPLRHLGAQLENRFASLVLTSLDGRPIARASRLLLTAGAAVSNTGMQWDAARTAVKPWGGPPALIEPVKGRVVLGNLQKAAAVEVWALDGAGHRLGRPAAATRSRQAWEFTLGEPATTWYEIVVRR